MLGIELRGTSRNTGTMAVRRIYRPKRKKEKVMARYLSYAIYILILIFFGVSMKFLFDLTKKKKKIKKTK